VIAQRLVRQLCLHCKEKTEDELSLPVTLTINDVVYRAVGCAHCRKGYEGRTAIFEVLLPDEVLMPLFMSNLSFIDISKSLIKEGWLSLYQAGVKKILLGQTTLNEVQRVIGYA